MYRLKKGKPEGTRPLTRPRCSWEHIKIGFKGMGCEGVEWI